MGVASSQGLSSSIAGVEWKIGSKASQDPAPAFTLFTALQLSVTWLLLHAMPCIPLEDGAAPSACPTGSPRLNPAHSD